MSDRTNNQMNLHSLMAICILAALPLGCASSMGNYQRTTTQQTAITPAEESTADKPVGKPDKFQPPREVAPEDVEAFQNAVDQISRLEYGPAESEMRILLVRFESVDDPKYVSEALFWLGYCCEKQGVIEQARDYYQRVIEHYADTRPGKQAAQRLKLLPPE